MIFTDATSSILPKTPGTGPASISQEPDWPSLKVKGLTEDQKRQIVGLSGGLVPFDFDGDGDLDLLEVGVQSIRLLRNDGGKSGHAKSDHKLHAGEELFRAVVGISDDDLEALGMSVRFERAVDVQEKGILHI